MSDFHLLGLVSQAKLEQKQMGNKRQFIIHYGWLADEKYLQLLCVYLPSTLIRMKHAILEVIKILEQRVSVSSLRDDK
jgi:hypothetical protein